MARKKLGRASIEKPPGRMPPLQFNAKHKILTAALKVFSRDGFDGASIPKIAEASGVGHPLVHYYFGTKDNLWRETVDFAFGSLNRDASLVASASRNLEPIDRLRVLIRAFTHFAARYPDHFGLLLAEARSDSERLIWLRENYADAFLGKLQGILREAQLKQQIRDIPVDHLSFILMGAMLLFFSANFHLPQDADMERLADAHADHVTAVLLEGVGLQRDGNLSLIV